MSAKIKNLYNDLCSLYRQLNPDKKGNQIDFEIREKYWAPYKNGTLSLEKIEDVIKGMRDEVAHRALVKEKEKLKTKLTFFGFKKVESSSAPPKLPTSSPSLVQAAHPTPQCPDSSSSTASAPAPTQIQTLTTTTSTSTSSLSTSSSVVKPTPARDRLNSEIKLLKDNIVGYHAIPVPTIEIRKQMAKDKETLKNKEKKLKELIAASSRNKKSYGKKKEVLKRALQCQPEDSGLQKYSQAKVGRPSVEESQPGIIDALKEVVQINLAGADEKRRSEVKKSLSL